MTDLSPRLWFESLHTRWWSAVDADFRGHALDEGPLGGLVEQAWSAGGKRLRALLPLALAEAVGADPRALLPWAGACEAVHNGTLVHDDLQDGDTLRRGKPALWTVHGAAQAINAGSAMYVAGFLQVDRCAGSPAARARALARLQRGLLRVVDGQTREFVASDRLEPSWEAWHAIVERKTGALFAATLAGAAELVEALAPRADTLGDLGVQLGVLFQMQDDLLDLVEEKGRERRGTDLAEGKISAVVLAGLDRAKPDDARRLLEIVTRPRDETTDAEVDEALSLLDRCGAIADVAGRLVALRRAIEARAQDELPAGVAELVARAARLFLEPVARHLPPAGDAGA